MKTSTFTKNILSTSIAIALLSLSACSSDNGDNGNSTTSLSGQAIDDNIAYARVYVDINQNGKFDASFEPYAYTDGSGYFSKSHDGTNYCADPKSEEYKFCLNVNENLTKGAVLRVEEGRDLLTALQYDASMSMLTDGSTTGLNITAISSLSQVKDQLKNLTAELNLSTDEQNKINSADLQAFLDSYLSSTQGNTQNSLTRSGQVRSISANKVNPLADNKSFKLGIRLHKLAETIATYFGKKELTFKEGNFLGRKAGNKLASKDIVPFVYMALFLDLDLTTSDPLANLDQANFSNILSKVSNLLSPLITGTNLPTQTELSNFAAALNDLYAKVKSYTDNSGTSVTERKKALAKTELITQSVKKKIKKDGSASQSDINEISTQVDNASQSGSGIDYKTLDFETAVDQAAQNQTINASGRTFEDVLTYLTGDNGNSRHYFDFNSNNGDKLKVYFKQKKVQKDEMDNITARKGDIIVCMKTSQNDEGYFKGSWSWSSEKSYALMAQYLGVAVTIKNLVPSNTNCQAGSGSCVSITYPNIDNIQQEQQNVESFKTSYFSDKQDWSTPTNIDQIDFVKTTSDIPASQEQCEFK